MIRFILFLLCVIFVVDGSAADRRRRSAPPSGFKYYASAFDGATTLTNLNPQGMADGKAGLVSFWFKQGGASAANQNILVHAKIIIKRNASNKMQILAYNAAGGAPILSLQSTTNYTASSTWHHFLAGWDLAVPTSFFYVDGYDNSGNATNIDDTIDYNTFVKQFTFGSSATPNAFYTGSICEFYFTGTYIDSTTALAAFRNGTKPKSLGATGALPTGAQPWFYFHNPYDSFGTQQGSAGPFTVLQGALTSDTGP